MSGNAMIAKVFGVALLLGVLALTAVPLGAQEIVQDGVRHAAKEVPRPEPVPERCPDDTIAHVQTADTVAQQQQASVPAMPGINSVFVNLSLMQSSSSNWASGEQDYFALSFMPTTTQRYPVGPLVVMADLSMRLGANYVDDSIRDEAIRVTDNEFSGVLMTALPLGWKIDPFISFSLRTPVTENFYFANGERYRTEKFWDPVTSQQTAGLTYNVAKPGLVVNARMGLALQQIRAHFNTALTDDYKTPGVIEAYKAQSIIDALAEVAVILTPEITYVGRFSLSSTFTDPDVWYVKSYNQIRCKVWGILGVSLNADLIQDVRQSPRTQFRQTIMFGILQNL